MGVGLSPVAVAARRQVQPPPISGRELAQFAHINALARQVQRRYRQAFAHASSPGQAQQVARQMDQAVTSMFRREGMSVRRYRQIRRYLMQEALNGTQPMQVAGNTPPRGGGS